MYIRIMTHKHELALMTAFVNDLVFLLSKCSASYSAISSFLFKHK